MDIAIIGSLAAFIGCIVLLQNSRSSLGLPIIYLVGFIIAHLPGGLVHYLHPYQLQWYRETLVGMRMTAVCMLAFTGGTAIYDAVQRSEILKQRQAGQSIRFDPEFWRFCTLYGIIISVLIAPLISFPSVGTIIKAAANLWILGILLAVRYHSSKGNVRFLPGWIGASLISPFFTLISDGFLGFGIIAISSAYCVLLVRPKKLISGLISFSLAFYFSLGLAVTYFAGREQIRDSVWGGESNAQRLESIKDVFSEITFFDPDNLDHAYYIDLRLNQNNLVGHAENYMRFAKVPLLNGKTISDSLIALIPRALWPEKPVFSGSGSLVSDVTGLSFAEGTSVGIGNVLESYVNFGWLGLLLINIPLGYFIRWLDFRAFRAEASGDYTTLLTSFLPGLALNAVGGAFAEATAAALASWLAAKAWMTLWRRIKDS